MHVRLIAAALSFLLWSCSCGSGRSEAPPPRTSVVPAPTTTPTAPTYAVHEWGLVRAGAHDTLEVGAIGPHAPTLADIGAIEKPVLYFHLAGEGPLDVSVGVRAGEGEIREHWPLASDQVAPHDITWPRVQLHASGTCPVPSFAGAAATACGRLDPGEACETLDLARAFAANTSCLTLPDATPVLDAPFLFYRVRTRALTVPLAAFGLDFGDINVRNDGDLPIPGRLIRFQRNLATIRAVVVDPPAPHTTIVVGHDFGGPEVARAAVSESLTGIGLTNDEASAFLTSWDEAFFGSGGTEREHAAEEIPPPDDSILYFLPEPDVERLAHLELAPAPSEVHRAMAVWTTLR
jgi:hypothetical protein